MVITWFPHSIIMCRIELREYVATKIGPSRKLDEERQKQVVKILFINVPEVKIKIGRQGRPGIV